MTNTNCLKGIRCPQCGNEDRFRIAATSLFTVTDDGTDDYGDVEWNDDSCADCPECGLHGTLKDFRAQMTSDDYFSGPTGTRYRYAEIADRIRREAPHTLGKHISVQLEAIGLLDEMAKGTTPCALPYTFAEAPEAPDTERQHKIAPALLAALKCALEFLEANDDGEMDVTSRIASAQVAIAAAEAAGIVPEPTTAPRLLAAIQAVLPYAEAERTSLCEAWRRDRDRAVNVELHACDIALGDAAAAIAEANAIGIISDPAEIDIHSLLAARRQIAVIWSVEDVQELRPALTDDQGWEVLKQAKDRHTADVGISWDVLEMHAAELFGSAPETADPEEE